MPSARNNSQLHILLFFMDSQRDYLDGIKEILKRTGDKIIEINLTDAEYKSINKAENSKYRLFLRIYEMLKIFRRVEKLIHVSIAENYNNATVNIFCADEGVWGEFINVIRGRIKHTVKTINVQHGLFILNEVSFMKMRILLNKLSTKYLNYPLDGKGFGGSEFDVYFVYGKKEEECLSSRARTSKIIVAPQICKYSFLKKNQEGIIARTDRDISKNILFAMQPTDVCSLFLYTEKEIYSKLLPLFQFLRIRGYSIIFRLHPAQSLDNSKKIMEETNLINYIELDTEKSLGDSLKKVCAVMSLFSTTLFDAYLIGKIPIVLHGLTKPFDFPVPHETINLESDWKKDICEILKRKAKYPSHELNTDMEIFQELFS